MNLTEQINHRFLSLLLSTPEGRAHFLSQAAEAESNGEGGVFDRLLAKVDDPEIRRLVGRHQADEVRHAALFTERLAQTGVTPEPVPAHLQLIDRLDEALGKPMDMPMKSRRDVMEAYLLLQVVEERGVTQYGLMEPVLRIHDPATADLLVEIIRDEARHLKYCRAIARRYAPDEATLTASLLRYRRIEAQVYAEHGRANMRYLLEKKILRMGALETLGWRAISALMAVRGKGQRTPFWTDATPASEPDELAMAA
jgi:rubrerythrin